MKKITTQLFALALAALTVVACVDNDYDLSKIETGDMVFAPQAPMPIASITIPLQDFFPDEPGAPGVPTSVDIPPLFNSTMDIDTSFDTSILDNLAQSDVPIVATVEFNMPPDIYYNITIEFLDDQGGTLLTAIDDKTIDTNNGIVEITLTVEQLKMIAEAGQINIQFETVDEDGNAKPEGYPGTPIDLNNLMQIYLSTAQMGGIKA